MTFKPIFTINDAITSALTSVERARGFLEAATLSEAWISSMQNKMLLLEAHHTTHIEGTQLTLEQSAKLFAGENVEQVDPDDKQELLNYRAAFDLVSDYLGKGAPITEMLIREIHKSLVQGVRGNAASPGQYRKVQNYVVNSVTQAIIYEPPQAYDVSILMEALVQWLNNENSMHPVLIAGIAQFQLVHIHPFLDGNGRPRVYYQRCVYFKKAMISNVFLRLANITIVIV